SISIITPSRPIVVPEKMRASILHSTYIVFYCTRAYKPQSYGFGRIEKENNSNIAIYIIHSQNR
ncbi:MAG: hypothetical protein NTV98_00660, partial [Candidatus Roizmanbacteria bacterium]|nr:hypothetical protein [Candidatus Roizmanbacteria bacterium]